ncbi:hypothetical protein T459_04055 [Capsicum annuum]|uniref:Uncharacterized protein n=1 Tax=Capsicum annuum TaxID=4072 RepID=A0A2G3APS5_CAPAN|nr:hypothetical protein T459_04055 [Capsicum annuum]
MATPTQTPANTTQAPANSSQVPANNSQHLSTSPARGKDPLFGILLLGEFYDSDTMVLSTLLGTCRSCADIEYASEEVSSSQSSNHEKNLMELPVSPDSRFSISRHVPVVVSLNSTDGLSQRLQVLERREQVSTQQKRRKHVNAVDKVISTSSPVRNSSNHMLRYIASLTPDEARAYAKREIENAPLVTDDHDLYTPLFRNVSMFKRINDWGLSKYICTALCAGEELSGSLEIDVGTRQLTIGVKCFF